MRPTLEVLRYTPHGSLCGLVSIVVLGLGLPVGGSSEGYRPKGVIGFTREDVVDEGFVNLDLF